MHRFTLFLFGTLLTFASAQLQYLRANEIDFVWDVPLSKSVGDDNGLFLTPDGSHVVLITSDCSLYALDAKTGAQTWTHSVAGATCSGGVFFAPTYLVFSAAFNTESEIVALDTATGDVVFTTGSVPGIAMGAPVTTSDGQYVLTTSNVNGSTGYMTMFDKDAPDAAVFEYDSFEPFGALGYVWNPVQGYYEGGFGNTEDLFMWSFDNEMSNTTVGVGQLFAFQISDALNVSLVGDERAFQTPHPPIFANDGLSMYWSVSKSETRCWVGEENLARRSFDKNNLNNRRFNRGSPPSSTAKAPPSLSSDPLEPAVFGPSASNQIFRLGFDCAEDSLTVIDTIGIVHASVVVSPDDQFVYYATPAPDSSLYQLESTFLREQWKVPLIDGVLGEMAVSTDGSLVYVVDTNGYVRAYRVALPPPTEEPSMAPSAAPSAAPVVPTEAPTTGPPSELPSMSPSQSPTTNAPSAAPSTSPAPTTAAPTLGSPTSSPTAMPTTDSPTVAPVASPTPAPVPVSTPAPISQPGTQPTSGSSLVATGLLLVVVAAVL